MDKKKAWLDFLREHPKVMKLKDEKIKAMVDDIMGKIEDDSAPQEVMARIWFLKNHIRSQKVNVTQGVIDKVERRIEEEDIEGKIEIRIETEKVLSTFWRCSACKRNYQFTEDGVIVWIRKKGRVLCYSCYCEIYGDKEGKDEERTTISA